MEMTKFTFIIVQQISKENMKSKVILKVKKQSERTGR